MSRRVVLVPCADVLSVLSVLLRLCGAVHFVMSVPACICADSHFVTVPTGGIIYFHLSPQTSALSFQTYHERTLLHRVLIR